MTSKKFKVKDLVNLINGFAFKSTDWGKEGRKILRIQNLNKSEADYNYTNADVDEKYIVKKGDLLIAWSGSLGVYEWTNEEEVLLNQHIFKAELKTDSVSKSYLKYVLEQALEELINKTRGVAFKHLKRNQIDNYEFKLPNLAEQEKIATKINKIQSLINKRRQSIALINEYFKNSFLEFFLENSQIASNTTHWQNIEKVIDSSVYGTGEKASEERRGMPVVRMNNLTYSGELDLTNLKWVECDETERKKYELKNGDVLFNRTNSKELVGKTAVWDRGEGYIFAGYLVKLVPKKDAITANYLSGFLNSDFGKKILFNKARPSGNLANFSPALLKTQKILVPPMSLQNEYDLVCQNVKNQKQKLLKSLDLLEELRQSFVYLIFNESKKLELDEIDSLIGDDIQLEIFLNSINSPDNLNEEQYSIEVKKLYKILKTTEEYNRDEGFRDGLVQSLIGNKIVLEMNKDFKNRNNETSAT